MFDVCVAGCGLYVSHVTSEEGEHGQRDADAQSPIAQHFPELFNVELRFFCLQLTSMSSGIVVAEALGYNHASSAIDKGEHVVAARVHNNQRSQRWRLNAGLLVELGRSLAGTCAQPFEGSDALGERWVHGRSSTWVAGIRQRSGLATREG